MTRWRLLIEYDGGSFVGWQRQDNGRSVQQTLEEAVHGFTQETVTVHGAGRTDSGVHALGQVAHFDLARETDSATVRDAVNFHLKPDPVTILEAAEVDQDFHARFSAIGRHYRYRILNRRAPAAVERGHVWHIPVELDWRAMHEAGQTLTGQHDFTSFRAAECQSDSPVKTLDALSVERHANDVVIEARARSFLHNQVRIIVGTLRLVGEGKWSSADVEEALAARDRARAGPTAPPDGLYLTRVDY
jgi:tRNA pseudouridine38-40 synthase